mmetsp:Transcript_121544/g.259467  ORF Transcript_121544/g.259467 Transcript_121544/m.259467 type:complete len:204 (-) Transcript_121544:36-647(-)
MTIVHMAWKDVDLSNDAMTPVRGGSCRAHNCSNNIWHLLLSSTVYSVSFLVALLLFHPIFCHDAALVSKLWSDSEHWPGFSVGLGGASSTFTSGLSYSARRLNWFVDGCDSPLARSRFQTTTWGPSMDWIFRRGSSRRAMASVMALVAPYTEFLLSLALVAAPRPLSVPLSGVSSGTSRTTQGASAAAPKSKSTGLAASNLSR